MCSRLFDVSGGLGPPLLTQDPTTIDRPQSALQESVESLRQRYITCIFAYLMLRTFDNFNSISTPIGHEFHKRFPQLDYSRLKNDLLTLPDNGKIILLKALRWVSSQVDIVNCNTLCNMATFSVCFI